MQDNANANAFFHSYATQINILEMIIENLTFFEHVVFSNYKASKYCSAGNC